MIKSGKPNTAFGSFVGLTLNDYSPEDEENPTSYHAAAPQYNFDTPGRLVIPGEEMPNSVLRFSKMRRLNIARIGRSEGGYCTNYRQKNTD